MARTRTKSSTSTGSDDTTAPQQYLVEALRVFRVLPKRGKRAATLQFEVKWKGYSEKENTWEPIENLGEGVLQDNAAMVKEAKLALRRATTKEKHSARKLSTPVKKTRNTGRVIKVAKTTTAQTTKTAKTTTPRRTQPSSGAQADETDEEVEAAKTPEPVKSTKRIPGASQRVDVPARLRAKGIKRPASSRSSLKPARQLQQHTAVTPTSTQKAARHKSRGQSLVAAVPRQKRTLSTSSAQSSQSIKSTSSTPSQSSKTTTATTTTTPRRARKPFKSRRRSLLDTIPMLGRPSPSVPKRRSPGAQKKKGKPLTDVRELLSPIRDEKKLKSAQRSLYPPSPRKERLAESKVAPSSPVKELMKKYKTPPRVVKNRRITRRLMAKASK